MSDLPLCPNPRKFSTWGDFASEPFASFPSIRFAPGADVAPLHCPSGLPRTEVASSHDRPPRIACRGGTAMKHPRREFLHLAAGAAALAAVSRLAWAQAYPTRPVRIIVGFA